MKAAASITTRLVASVLLLEFLAAFALIVAVTNHERQVQFEAFEANLRATANALLGSVQEADSRNGSVELDTAGIHLPPRAHYSVIADTGQVLGSRGALPRLALQPDHVTRLWLDDHPYRFYVLTGERIIDPGSPGTVTHHVTVIYGAPEGPTWSTIFAATRFFALATLLLLGVTALLLSWLIRRLLRPIHVLAKAAETVDLEHGVFHAPASSSRFSELRPLAAAIENAVARLQRSLQQQRQFTNDAAHELKTDLAIVKSSIQLLAMKRRTIDEYHQGLRHGLDDLAGLESTVHNMLTFARLTQAPARAAASSNLTEAVLDTIAQSQPFANIRQIAISQEIPPKETRVPLNREDARLLCSNILMNALQYSPLSGTVQVTLRQENQSITLRILDRGEGIAEEDLPFLFDAFYRGDPSRSRKSGNAGLGLSICKAICARAGGKIQIQNRPGGGAQVEIQLPTVNYSGSSVTSMADTVA